MKKLFLSIIILFSVVASFACTTFFLNNGGHYYFGRNYDWVTGNGMVMMNARSVEKVQQLKAKSTGHLNMEASLLTSMEKNFQQAG